MKYKNMQFWAEDGAEGGGAVDLLGPIETSKEAPTGGEGDAPPPVEPKPAPGFDPEAFAKVLKEHFPPSEPKSDDPFAGMTPEQKAAEATKLLKVYQFTPEWQAKFGNLETQGAALAEMRDGLLAQFDTLTRYRLQELQQQLEAQYAPLRESMAKQETEASWGRFDSALPQLSDPKLRPMVGSILQQLKSEGKTFANEQEIFVEVGKRAESMIQTVNPQFKLETAKAGTTQPKPGANPNALKPGAVPGASGGAAGGGGKGTTGPKAIALLR